jgi:hypothetical protein
MACKKSELYPLSPRGTFEPPATREPGQDSPHSLTPFRIPGERECWSPRPSKYKRIRRASVRLVVGYGGQNPRHPRLRPLGEKPSGV